VSRWSVLIGLISDLPQPELLHGYVHLIAGMEGSATLALKE